MIYKGKKIIHFRNNSDIDTTKLKPVEAICSTIKLIGRIIDYRIYTNCKNDTLYRVDNNDYEDLVSLGKIQPIDIT